MDLTVFFQEQGIDVFSEVSLNNLSDEVRSSVVHFFPAAQSVIVFGKEVPVPVYLMPQKEKTRGMLRIAEALDNTAVRHRQSPGSGAGTSPARSAVPARENC